MDVTQYEKLFCTCRIPDEIEDKLETWPDSKHIAITHRGIWYILNIYHKNDIIQGTRITCFILYYS